VAGVCLVLAAIAEIIVLRGQPGVRLVVNCLLRSAHEAVDRVDNILLGVEKPVHMGAEVLQIPGIGFARDLTQHILDLRERREERIAEDCASRAASWSLSAVNAAAVSIPRALPSVLPGWASKNSIKNSRSLRTWAGENATCSSRTMFARA